MLGMKERRPASWLFRYSLSWSNSAPATDAGGSYRENAGSVLRATTMLLV